MAKRIKNQVRFEGKIYRSEAAAFLASGLPIVEGQPFRKIYREVFMTDSKRTQNQVRANGTKYRSVAAAFIALNLPISKHQEFRKILKKEKKATFENIEFELVVITK